MSTIGTKITNTILADGSLNTAKLENPPNATQPIDVIPADLNEAVGQLRNKMRLAFGLEMPQLPVETLKDHVLDTAKHTISDVALLSGEAIALNKIVYFNGTDIRHADYSSINSVDTIGIALESKGSGLVTKVRLRGLVTITAHGYTGKFLYLGTSGNMTTTMPVDHYVIQVGRIIDANTISIDVQPIMTYDS